VTKKQDRRRNRRIAAKLTSADEYVGRANDRDDDDNDNNNYSDA